MQLYLRPSSDRLRYEVLVRCALLSFLFLLFSQFHLFLCVHPRVLLFPLAYHRSLLRRFSFPGIDLVSSYRSVVVHSLFPRGPSGAVGALSVVHDCCRWFSSSISRRLLPPLSFLFSILFPSREGLACSHAGDHLDHESDRRHDPRLSSDPVVSTLIPVFSLSPPPPPPYSLLLYHRSSSTGPHVLAIAETRYHAAARSSPGWRS